jgi:hypothetical protein
MRKTLCSVVLLAFGVAVLMGCNNKSIELDKEKVVPYDAKRDGDPKAAGGPGGGPEGAQGSMKGGGKKSLPPPK